MAWYFVGLRFAKDEGQKSNLHEEGRDAGLAGADANRPTAPEVTFEATGTTAVDALVDVTIDTAATGELSDPVSAPCTVIYRSELASGDLYMTIFCPAVVDPADTVACDAQIGLVLGSCDE